MRRISSALCSDLRSLSYPPIFQRNTILFNVTRLDSTQSASMNTRFAFHSPIFISSGTGQIGRRSFQPPHVKPFHIFLFHYVLFHDLKTNNTISSQQRCETLASVLTYVASVEIKIRVRHGVSQTFSSEKHD